MRNYLHTLRKKNAFTQRDVAQKLGISESYYSLIEHGGRQKKLSLEFAKKISDIFSVPLEEILNYEKMEEKQ